MFTSDVGSGSQGMEKLVVSTRCQWSRPAPLTSMAAGKRSESTKNVEGAKFLAPSGVFSSQKESASLEPLPKGSISEVGQKCPDARQAKF